MGCFGYICNKCGQNIREDEKCVLRHLRHGEILGEATGSYSGYGGVKEDKVFRSRQEEGLTTINTHEELCASDFDFKDSKHREIYRDHSLREYKGEPVNLAKFFEIVEPEYKDLIQKLHEYNFSDDILSCNIAELSDLLREFNELPFYQDKVDPEIIKSGVVAFHSKCYHSLKDNPEDEKLRRTPSESDYNQGCGVPRKKFL